MVLEKDGIRIEMTSPADIARFKGFGYKEVIEEPKPKKEKAVKNAENN